MKSFILLWKGLVVSVGIGWLHRQAYPTALVKEDYLNITLGVNFNELWFRKNRIY